MQKSKARTLVRVLLGIGIVIGLISRFIPEEGPAENNLSQYLTRDDLWGVFVYGAVIHHATLVHE